MKKDKMEVKEEVKQAPKPVKMSDDKLGNEHHFLVGQEYEVKGLKFLVKETRGVDLVLARKDFK